MNIGGINVTYLPKGGGVNALRAFDTGPGNMVLDAIVQEATQGKRTYDAGGRMARRGTVNEALLRELMAHPFLIRRPPKSTGREEFGAPFVQALVARRRTTRLSIEDVLATCAAWTAEAIALSAMGLR
ncbi:MAG: anhydro-N-acetylmuramic acid kinase [Nitrospira sp.]